MIVEMSFFSYFVFLHHVCVARGMIFLIFMR